MASFKPTFTKPPKVRWVDMAIYIDNLIYREADGGEPFSEEEEETIYKYLYLLGTMLASKRKFFTKIEDYDSFGLWFATKMYIRLTDPRQFTGEKRLTRVKSILNFMKVVLYGKKCEWQQQNYQEIMSEEVHKTFNSDKMISTIKDEIQQQYLDGIEDSIIEGISEFPSELKKVIKATPYKNDKLMCKRLYTSVLLSVINSVTLRNEFQKKLSEKEEVRESYLLRLHNRERVDPVIVWHLPEDMRDYVTLLYRKSIKKMISNIQEINNNYMLEDEVLDAIMRSAYGTNPTGESDE